MLELQHKGPIGETLEAHVPKIFDSSEATDRIWKSVWDLSTLPTLIATFVRLKRALPWDTIRTLPSSPRRAEQYCRYTCRRSKLTTEPFILWKLRCTLLEIFKTPLQNAGQPGLTPKGQNDIRQCQSYLEGITTLSLTKCSGTIVQQCISSSLP